MMFFMVHAHSFVVPTVILYDILFNADFPTELCCPSLLSCFIAFYCLDPYFIECIIVCHSHDMHM